MNEITHYKTIQHDNTDKFDQLINDSIAHGWSVYGFPQITVKTTSPIRVYYFQTMVKRDA